MKVTLLLFVIIVFAVQPAFAGCIKGNCQNGQGTYAYSPEGHQYVGEFKDGKRNGQGVYTWPDANTYTGKFNYGKPDGKGVYLYPKGHKFEGVFKNGKFTGYSYYVESPEKIHKMFRENATIPDMAPMIDN